MKLIIGFISVLMFFNGCSKTPKADQIVKVINDCGANNISVSDIKGRKTQDGFMKAQVIGYNSSSDYELLEYQIIWLDRDGFKIDTIMSKFKNVPAFANRPFYINAISPTTKAKTFRIYIRKDKEIICNKESN